MKTHRGSLAPAWLFCGLLGAGSAGCTLYIDTGDDGPGDLPGGGSGGGYVPRPAPDSPGDYPGDTPAPVFALTATASALTTTSSA